MKIQPIDNTNFGNKKIYQRTVKTSYGRCIEGCTDNKEYFVYVAENPITHFIKHKLYVVNKLFGGDGKQRWLKSYLRFYDEKDANKMTKEIRSCANDGRT
jgi:hypothetical protein